MSTAGDILTAIAVPAAQLVAAKAAGALDDRAKRQIAAEAIDLAIQTGLPLEQLARLVTERGAAATEVALAIAQDLAYGPRGGT